MDINTPAEAFAAIAAAMVGADGIGTTEERLYLETGLFERPAFAGMEPGAFKELLLTASDSVWSTLPNDGVRITEEGLNTLIGACADVLGADLRAEACRMAEALADVDGRTHEEHGLILTLRAGFGLS